MEIKMSEKNYNGGVSFCGLLTLIFITLKLTNFIDWSWWWILAPLWIPVGLIIFIVIILLLILFLKEVFE